MKMYKKIASKNLRLNKKRTILTIIGIALSVSLICAVSIMASSLYGSLTEYEKDMWGDFHIAVSNVQAEDLNEYGHDENIGSYFTISEIGFTSIPESRNEYLPYARIVSMNDDGLKGSRLKLIEGRLPENDKEIVIPIHLKTLGEVNYKVGDELSFEVGKRVSESDESEILATKIYTKDEKIIDTVTKEYKVVGVIERPARGIERGTCPGYYFITKSDELSEKVDFYARYNRLGIENWEKDEKADKDYIYTNDMLIEMESFVPQEPVFKIFYSFIAVVLAVIVFTSVYCIKNSFDISLSEKIRQYGMLRSVGATKRQIKKCVYSEAAFIGFVGIGAGTALGLLISYIMIETTNRVITDLLDFTVLYQPSVFALITTIVLGFVTIFLSASKSARKAAKVSPMEAIRNNKEIKVNTWNVRTPSYVRKIWGAPGVISYKNIRRNKHKYRTTVVSIAVCSAAFIGLSYMATIGMGWIEVYETKERYNLSIDFKTEKTYELVNKDMKKFSLAEEVSITQHTYVHVDDPEMTEAYEDILEKKDYETDYAYFTLIALDDESFKKYAKECGQEDAEGKAILVDTVTVEWEEHDKNMIASLRAFEYEPGDEIEFHKDDGNCNLEFAAVTDIRPMGFASSKRDSVVVISESTRKENDIEVMEEYEVFFVSDEVDKLQKQVNEYVKDSNFSYFDILNRKESVREQKSVFLLVEFFGYGFVIVLALVGITSIINTLNTNIELRSRDFAMIKSVGITNTQFKKMIRAECVFISLKSLITGVAGGMILSYGINQLEKMDNIEAPFHPPIMISIAVCLVVIFIIYIIISSSLKRINKRSIVDTIQNENI